jgi:D-amino-acid dehydrogenase
MRPLIDSAVVLGGGLIGLTTAFSLAHRGIAVTVIDAGPLGGGAARGNAGYFAPSQLGPLPTPYALREALRAVGRPHSAVYLRPSGAVRMTPWLARFVRNCTASRAEAATAALRRLDSTSLEAIGALAAAGVTMEGTRGIVCVNATREAAEHAAVAFHGSPVVTGDELKALVPCLGDPSLFGTLLDADRSIDPGRFVDSLIEVLGERGVMFVPGSPVRRFETDGRHVRAVVTDHGRHPADVFVLAAGSGTPKLSAQLGVRLPVTTGKGYSFSVPLPRPLPHAILFETDHVACTPFADRFRIAGTMELGGVDGQLDKRRIDGLVRSVRRLMPEVDVDARTDEWVGSRPITPDGMPVIGRPKGWDNVLVGAGHGMYGLTLAPATGEAIAGMVLGDTDVSAFAAFAPDRF